MDNRPSFFRIPISTIIIIILIVIVAIETFFLITSTNNEIVLEDPDDRPAIMRDENGTYASMKLTCQSGSNYIYFYHSNTYQIYDETTDKIIEDGNYSFANSSTIELTPIAKAERTIKLDNKNLTDGNSQYTCEDYE